MGQIQSSASRSPSRDRKSRSPKTSPNHHKKDKEKKRSESPSRRAKVPTPVLSPASAHSGSSSGCFNSPLKEGGPLPVDTLSPDGDEPLRAGSPKHALPRGCSPHHAKRITITLQVASQLNSPESSYKLRSAKGTPPRSPAIRRTPPRSWSPKDGTRTPSNINYYFQKTPPRTP